MKLKLFTNAYLVELKDAVKNSKSLPLYSASSFPIKEECVWEHPIVTIDDDIKLLEPEGKDKTQFEFENGKILFEKIHGLKPDYATDPRIWSCLSHTVFWNYMQKRSPVPSSPKTNEQLVNHVLTHWFVENSSANDLMRNEISKLWWIIYLTFDNKRRDPYELSRLAFRDLDQTRTIYSGYQGKNKKMISSILDFEKDNPKLFEPGRELKYRELMKKLNYYGSYKILSSMSDIQMRQLLDGCRDFLSKLS